jgi:hypothetical protein
MRIGFMVAAIFALESGALAEDYGRPTAILVSPIHEAQIVRGDDGKDPCGIRTSRPQRVLRTGGAVERYCARSRWKGTHAGPNPHRLLSGLRQQNGKCWPARRR